MESSVTIPVTFSSEQKNRLKPLWIAVFVDILGFTVVLPFLPFFMQQYSTTPLVIGLLISSNAIFGFIFGPIIGKLSDHYGRKPFLIISQIGTTAGFLVLAFSQSLPMLFLARIIDGVFGGQLPIAKATIGDVVPPKERSRQMTNIGVAFTLASLIGPGLGALLSNYGIIGPGLMSAGLTAFTIGFTAISFQETLPFKTKIVEPWHQVSTQFQTESESLWKNHQAVYLLTQYGFAIIGITIFQSSLSLFGLIRLNLSITDIGLLFTFMGLFQVFFRGLLFNPMRKTLGDTRMAFIGLTSFIFAFFLLSFVSNFWTLMGVLFFISFSGACTRGILMGFTSRVVDHKNQGKVNGISSSLDNFCQIIGPIIGSVLLSVPSPVAFSLFLSGVAIIPFSMAFHVNSFQFDAPDKRSNVPVPK